MAAILHNRVWAAILLAGLILPVIRALVFYSIQAGYFVACAVFGSCRIAHVPMCQNGARYVTYVAIRTLFRDILKMAKMCKWLKYNINRKRM